MNDFVASRGRYTRPDRIARRELFNASVEASLQRIAENGSEWVSKNEEAKKILSERVNDDQWFGFMDTLPDDITAKACYLAVSAEINRRKATIVPEDPCTCRNIPDRNQCRFCAAKAAEVTGPF